MATGTEELVLSFLAESMAEYVSGEAISGKLGMSGAEVFRDVERLRGLGYRIDAVPARGYRLVEVPDRITALEIAPFLNTQEIGTVIHHHDVVGSTNATAMELARAGASQGEVVVAEEQTEGRGRRGRVWASPPGTNLYLSVILRPDMAAARAPELTLLAGVALQETLVEAGVPARLKWPNDLVAGDRKLGGILSELSVDGDRAQFVVVGIGVNLNCLASDLPADLRLSATSVREVRGEEVPRALFAAALLTRLEDWLDRWSELGFGPVLAAGRAASATLGREVRVAIGDRTLQGVAVDLDEDGALLVETAPGVRERVVSGDAQALRPV